MFTSGQWLLILIIGILFVYVIIDRICKCVETSRNPFKGYLDIMQFVNKLNEENGNKPL